MGSPANPHRHPHVAATIAYLRRLGADDVVVEPRRSGLKVGWDHEGQRLSISLSCHGGSEAHENIALQKVRQRYRAAGVEVRA